MMVKEPLDELTAHPPPDVRIVTGSPTSPPPPTSAFHSSSSWSQSPSPTHLSPLIAGSEPSTNPREFSSSSSHASSAWVPSATASPLAPTTPAVNVSYELDGELLSKEFYHLAIATALTLLVGLIQVCMIASLRRGSDFNE